VIRVTPSVSATHFPRKILISSVCSLFHICMYTVRSRVFFISSIVLLMRGVAIGMLCTLLIQPPPA
jgi:hypothetical protein